MDGFQFLGMCIGGTIGFLLGAATMYIGPILLTRDYDEEEEEQR